MTRMTNAWNEQLSQINARRLQTHWHARQQRHFSFCYRIVPSKVHQLMHTNETNQSKLSLAAVFLTCACTHHSISGACIVLHIQNGWHVSSHESLTASQTRSRGEIQSGWRWNEVKGTVGAVARQRSKREERSLRGREMKKEVCFGRERERGRESRDADRVRSSKEWLRIVLGRLCLLMHTAAMKVARSDWTRRSQVGGRWMRGVWNRQRGQERNDAYDSTLFFSSGGVNQFTALDLVLLNSAA